MASKAFLTVDSGGSKTCLALYTEEGVLVEKGNARGFGLTEDSGSVLEEARQILSDFCTGYENDCFFRGYMRTVFKKRFPDR